MHGAVESCASSIPNGSTPHDAVDHRTPDIGFQENIDGRSCMNTFGIAARNFTAYPRNARCQGAGRIRRQDGGAGLRFDLGVGPHPARRRAELPDHRLADAADRDRRAHQEDQALGPAFSCCRCATPWCWRSSSSSIDQLSDGRLLMAMAAGWYKREFDAVGVPFEQRGKIMDENLDILKRFWTEDMVNGRVDPSQDPGRRHVSRSRCRSRARRS